MILLQHGIRIFEIDATAAGSAGPDRTPPAILSETETTIAANAAFATTLVADQPVVWLKMGGADAAAFTLANARLSMAAQAYDPEKDSYVCALRAVDTAGNVTDFDVTVTIAAGDVPLALAGAAAGGVSGAAWSLELTATGGHPPYSFTLAAGALPIAGEIDAETGAAAGALLDPGEYSFTARVTDAHGATADRAFTVAVSEAADPGEPGAARFAVNLGRSTYYSGPKIYNDLLQSQDAPWAAQGEGASVAVTSKGEPEAVVPAASGATNIYKMLMMPIAPATVKFTWEGGSGARVSIGGAAAGANTLGDHEITCPLTWVDRAGEDAFAHVDFTLDDPADAAAFNADPPRNLKCVEVGNDSGTTFDPAYIAWASQFAGARTMDWQNTNLNTEQTQTLANRMLPGDLVDSKTGKFDGVCWEDMAELATLAGYEYLWNCVPWDVEDAYVSAMAAYMRAHLPGNCKWHVELGNEVWNTRLNSYGAALRYANAHGITGDDWTKVVTAHATRHAEVMGLVAAEWEGAEDRLVRVLAWQNGNTDDLTTMLGLGALAATDALSTAPYFLMIDSAASAEDVFADVWPTIDEPVQWAANVAALAASNGLDYVMYEGGMHVTANTSGSDATIPGKVAADPRIKYWTGVWLAELKRRIGDDSILFYFNDVSRPGSSGAWGLKTDQSAIDADAPKLQAALSYIAGVTPPYYAGAATLTGSLEVDETIGVNDTRIHGAETVSHQWFWSDTDADIDGATEATYLITADDVGHVLNRRTVMTNAWGSHTFETVNATPTAADLVVFEDDFAADLTSLDGENGWHETTPGSFQASAGILGSVKHRQNEVLYRDAGGEQFAIEVDFAWNAEWSSGDYWPGYIAFSFNDLDDSYYIQIAYNGTISLNKGSTPDYIANFGTRPTGQDFTLRIESRIEGGKRTVRCFVDGEPSGSAIDISTQDVTVSSKVGLRSWLSPVVTAFRTQQLA